MSTTMVVLAVAAFFFGPILGGVLLGLQQPLKPPRRTRTVSFVIEAQGPYR